MTACVSWARDVGETTGEGKYQPFVTFGRCDVLFSAAARLLLEFSIGLASLGAGGSPFAFEGAIVTPPEAL